MVTIQVSDAAPPQRTPISWIPQDCVSSERFPGVATPTRTENPEAIWRHVGKTGDVPEFAK